MKRRDLLALAAAAFLPRTSMAQAAIDAMRFSALQPGAALPEWLKLRSFPSRPRHTEFALVEDRARARCSPGAGR